MVSSTILIGNPKMGFPLNVSLEKMNCNAEHS
jgi:hypothetical protein